MHLIEYAPSSRARCRRCRNAVAKGALRVRTTAFVCPQRATCFVRCMPCIDRQFAASVLAVYKEACRVPCNPSVSDTDVATARASLERAAAEGACRQLGARSKHVCSSPVVLPTSQATSTDH